MKILLIGHSVEDTIYYKGTTTRKPGGLYYTAAAMSGIKNDDDEIFLCTALEENNYFLFAPVYDELNTSLCIKGESLVPRVRLDLFDDREREERFENLGVPLTIPYRLLDKFDGILINMISGFDIVLETLAEIRKNYKGPVYMDVHTLTRGLDGMNKRPQVIIKDFSRWAENLDIIQVNETEVFSLYESKSETEIAAKLLSTGVRCLIVTKDKKGAGIYTRQGEEMQYVFRSAEKIKINNRVGCGDVFGAVFFHSFIKFGSVAKSLRLANKAAGTAASYERTDEMHKLKDDVFARHN